MCILLIQSLYRLGRGAIMNQSLTTFSKRYQTEKCAGELKTARLSVLFQHQPTDFESYIYEPVICLILQGSKQTTCGDRTVSASKGDAILVSHHLTVLSRITKASAEEPYIALILAIDLGLLRSLYAEFDALQLGQMSAKSIAAGPADELWLDPLTRYCNLVDHPVDMRVLGPALLREIHYRLLTSPIGAMLRNLMVLDSYASRIAKATERLKANFSEPMKIAELAKDAGMSMTMLHVHFKEVTGTTPLQFQKDLRLTEARRHIINGQKAAEAAFAVGYESPSQFSRDYRRKFGYSPSETPKALPKSD
jgi:AraC-like DNA-binding protein